MNFLFVHQNFPGQYAHIVSKLAADPRHHVVFVTQRENGHIPGVRKIVYRPRRHPQKETHKYLIGMEGHVLNAQEVARIAIELKKSGFTPDVMLGHNGWGEIWYLKDVFPPVPLIGYFEFFYRTSGADIGFDPEHPPSFDDHPRIRTKNAGNLLGLTAADIGISPTEWQKSGYPKVYHPMLKVIHEGIDTTVVTPHPEARLDIPGSGIVLGPDDEVVTYVARNLEPYRGFSNFMRSLPAILRARPHAHIVIVGGDSVSYGSRLRDGRSYKQKMLDELNGSLDMLRVHFLGSVPYATYLKVLQISRAHVYLTYPFVLSWSMLEAMSAGCLIVGSRTPPVEELIKDKHNGILVDFFDFEDISDKVIQVLAEPSVFGSLRNNARQTVVDKYDLHTVCLPQYMDLLYRL